MVAEAGGEPLEIHCDVTRLADLQLAADQVARKWGGLDILVNNAGVGAAGCMDTTPLETWERLLAVNLKSVIYSCRTFIPLFKRQKSGYIANMASVAGIASLPEMGCYNVGKAGVISLTETLRSELSPFDIGVSVICPAFFKSNLMDQFTAPDERQHLMARAFFDKSRYTAEQIAQHVIRSIHKNRFYIVTQGDARLVRHLKRFFPELYLKIVTLIYKSRVLKKYPEIRETGFSMHRGDVERRKR